MNKEEKEAIEILSYFEPDDLIEYAMYCNALNVIKNLIQKQEAIIDKMAEKLTTPVHSKQWVIEYYEKEVEKEC